MFPKKAGRQCKRPSAKRPRYQGEIRLYPKRKVNGQAHVLVVGGWEGRGQAVREPAQDDDGAPS